MMARSTNFPCRQAATMPSGIATSTVKTIVDSDSAMDGPMRSAIRLDTGASEINEVPRSPCASRPTQIEN
ncbi:hypothetical protein G6F46_015824 [Rhizopus delemar]|nr:hypothetical protein G6F60_015740 [Rhizopus arrhizus]KAG1577877.1 hypothetical protein G6F46_015824 [Rhizopus delemar]